MKLRFYLLSIIGTIFLLVLSYFKIFPMSIAEVFGFSTGAICVWLTVKQDIISWPIGLANNIFFIILFFQSRLFADMTLQFVYVVLGIIGWYMWLRGGKNKTVLKVSNISLTQIIILLIFVVITTYFMKIYLVSIHDAAPFLDALTTALSLAAQYMLTRKYIENWYVWITADVVYIYLYFIKSLYLTGVLYAMFLAMCIIGLRQWMESKRIAED
jgi:nicotinamide mononucleotide transporter